VIHPDLELIRGRLKVMSPCLQRTDYGQHLFIKDLVVSFGRRHGMGVEGDGSPEIVITFYREHGSSGKAELSILIRKGKDGSGGEGNFQSIEGLLFSGAPSPELVFSCEVIEWMSDLCEVLDEMAIEVRQPQEGSYRADLCRNWPLGYGLDLALVHADPFGSNHHA
ncbi:hypothetical protein M404DRAFT_125297, partial [Pisolithus tinctorius Marx 270]